MRSQLGSKTPQGDDRVSGSRTPPVPVRLDFDELIRDMLLILCSWDERIADAQRLTRPYTRMSLRRRDEVALPDAVRVLTVHFDTLLSLTPAPMRRIRSLRSAADLPPGTPGLVHPVGGYAEIIVDLGGADAGLELVSLHHRARSALRQTSPPPERLDGVPCRRCDLLSLERAAPPRSPDGPEYWSECTECGQLMTRADYVAWIKLYAAWVESQETAPLLEVG